MLEQPYVIASGKRERKKVERLDMPTSVPKEKPKLEIGEGAGTKLGDCPRGNYLNMFSTLPQIVQDVYLCLAYNYSA